MHPRNIWNQCLFMSCAGVIKQTLNYSFSTLQYTWFVISSIMSRLCLLFQPNAAWTEGTNLSLIDEVAMNKWVTWENYISQTSLVTYVFYSTFQVTIMWRTFEESLKKILRQLLLLRNHLKIFYTCIRDSFTHNVILGMLQIKTSSRLQYAPIIIAYLHLIIPSKNLGIRPTRP